MCLFLFCVLVVVCVFVSLGLRRGGNGRVCDCVTSCGVCGALLPLLFGKIQPSFFSVGSQHSRKSRRSVHKPPQQHHATNARVMSSTLGGGLAAVVRAEEPAGRMTRRPTPGVLGRRSCHQMKYHVTGYHFDKLIRFDSIFFSCLF